MGGKQNVAEAAAADLVPHLITHKYIESTSHSDVLFFAHRFLHTLYLSLEVQYTYETFKLLVRY